MGPSYMGVEQPRALLCDCLNNSEEIKSQRKQQLLIAAWSIRVQ